MNQLKSLALSLLILLLSAPLAFAQLESGEIKFKIDIDGLDEQTAAMMPAMKMGVVFNQEMTKVDMDMGMMKTLTLFNLSTHELDTYMDIMGQRKSIKMTKEEIDEQSVDESTYEIIETDEKADIAGYECRKVIIKTADGSLDMYVTDEIITQGQMNQQYKGLKGFPLRYSMQNGPMNMQITATEVIDRKVTANEFTHPEGYEAMTMEELMQMGGGF